jgi:hypothetical protein
MIPSQTSQVLLGIVVAVLYAASVTAIGVLPLDAVMGRKGSDTIRSRIGLFGFIWLGFVMGQGILGVVWLILSLAGILHAGLIWIVCTLGWILGTVILLAFRSQAIQAARQLWRGFLSCLHAQSWYLWVGMSVAALALLRGLIALLPTGSGDAITEYLPVAKAIAFSHTLEFQPFVVANNGLLPLQVELHWAALFAISNETAVAVWDYLCALSFLAGIGLLGWSLTSSRRVVILIVLILLSTPGFYDLMGSGKPGNAFSQYTIAAFLWLVFLPVLGRPSVLLAGLCAGWAMAGGYQNVIVPPALMVFAVMLVHSSWRASPLDIAVKPSKRFWVTTILVGGIAAASAGLPMLVKNWILVGCPLAPVFGCQQMYWTAIVREGLADLNLSVIDLFFYPFVWTFADRDDMLGHISPLFLGFLPFLVGARRSPLVRPTLMVGVAGLVSMSTWLLFIKPLILSTPYFIAPLGLLALPLSTSVVAVEPEFRHDRGVRWLVRGAIVIVLFFLLFQSRAVVYAARYIASIDSRAVRYESMPEASYDVATWMNAHVEPGSRVGLANFSIYRYFVDPDILVNSESAEERQWLWEHRDRLSPSDLRDFYARHGFTYVVVPKNRIDDSEAVKQDGVALKVAFVGRNDVVLKIEKE